MNTELLDEAFDGIQLLEVMCMAYELNRTDIISTLSGYCFELGDSYESAIYGIDALCDFYIDYASHDDNYYSEIRTTYVSTYNMMKYYHLCREYSSLTKTKLKNNPYMENAALYVSEQMNVGACYYCSYYLQTKINHDWASGVVFIYDTSEFHEHLAMFSRFLYVFDYYDREVVTLEKEVQALRENQKNKVIELPNKTQRRRAA